MYSTSFEKETDPDSSIKTYLKAIARWGRRPLSNNFWHRRFSVREPDSHQISSSIFSVSKKQRNFSSTKYRPPLISREGLKQGNLFLDFPLKPLRTRVYRKRVILLYNSVPAARRVCFRPQYSPPQVRWFPVRTKLSRPRNTMKVLQFHDTPTHPIVVSQTNSTISLSFCS